MSKPVVILVLLFIALVVLDIIIASVPIVESRVEDLTALQEKELETYLAARQLLTTLGTLSIGAMGGFIINRYKNAPLPNSQIQRAVISWTCSGASIYLGQVSHDKVLWMLGAGFFRLSSWQVAWPAKGQFYLFVLSIFFLADFIYRGLMKEQSDPN